MASTIKSASETVAKSIMLLNKTELGEVIRYFERRFGINVDIHFLFDEDGKLEGLRILPLYSCAVKLEDYNGRKIEAIKYVREATGWGLKETKDAVENKEIIKGLTSNKAHTLARQCHNAGMTCYIIVEF